MQAESFYQRTNERAVEICLISKSQFHDEYELFTNEVKNSLTTQNFKANSGQVCVISNIEGLLRKIYVGTGDGSDAQAIAQAVNRLPAGVYDVKDALSKSAAILWSLAQYRFDRYKAAESEPRVLLVGEDDLNDVLTEASAVFFVRDLINTPANDMGPKDLARVLSDLAAEHKAQFDQWVGEELIKHNYPAIHAVGRAAKDDPRLLSLTWGDESHPKVTLVGKGVCFDSGGLDVKPSNAMRLMKKDMGGAAQVMGLAKWIMTKRLPICLQVLIPAVENAISSDSFRPGDVLKMRNGLTVEVDNTDAEGRLILADVLVKACEERPELLIDFATLTGAARVAVGTEISAMFTDDDELAAALTEAAKLANDPVWRLPLFNGYSGMLDSSIADLVNSTPSPYAGAITAGLFLQCFVAKGIPWVHFDIMAWNVSNKPGKPEGGEAMGMQAVAHYLEKRYLKN